MELSHEHRQLLDGWQRGLPLVVRPYAAIADVQGVSEDRVLQLLSELQSSDVLSRIGAAVRPNMVGTSTLAAMSVAPALLDEVAAIVSNEPCVNHNYEREHAFNLWFVVAAPDRVGLADALGRLRAATGHELLDLPMERAYYLDLAFPLDLTGNSSKQFASDEQLSGAVVEPADRRLLAALEDGFAIESRPYLAVGRRCGMTEDAVIERLRRLLASGIISRLGLIVRHRALGIDANAMAVWDVDDDDVDRVGRAFSKAPYVTLCYRRPRRRPEWPYNLFTMVHGRDRSTVDAQVLALATSEGIAPDRRAVLFSRRCFVQRGARFKAA